MNLLADENIDAPIVKRLRADGHIIDYVAESRKKLTINITAMANTDDMNYSIPGVYFINYSIFTMTQSVTPFFVPS